ncbi:hypothetical protein GQ55_5G476800 [Panicum hallii var. hallii]|uniref:Uncharacterized protein n=1 Tax=Panicum hallii var. hallii TaxID=1504633 RepID=A0A2T7DR16_9POAL|nr:hypothetical protein GQ55_5G476800 [Panicum hallii var. hallii]
MASTGIAKGRAGAAAGVTEEAKAEWWLRFNNGVPAGDADAADSGDETEGAGEGAGGKAGMAVSGGRSGVAAAGDEEAEMGSGDGRVAAVARGAKAEMVARSGGKAEAGAGGERRSSPRFAEEISGGNYVLPGELPRRKRKAIAKRSKLKSDGVEVQNAMSQAQSPCPVLKGHEQVYGENENLRLQLAQKTSELKQEENRRLKLELLLKGRR